MNIGRRHNADPRWVLPLLCRRGHVTRGEIGAIRIGQSETYFQIPRAMASRFLAAVKRTANVDGDDESGIAIEQSATGPGDDRGPNPRANRPTLAPKRHNPARPRAQGAPRGRR